MFYKLFQALNQTPVILASIIYFLWVGLSLLLCVPPIIPDKICHFIMTRIVLSMVVIGWWGTVYNFCEYPSLTNALFLLASLSTCINLLSFEPVIRKCVPSGFSSLAYGYLIFIGFGHFEGIEHIVHFSSHVLLLLVSVFTFISLEPMIRFINASHRFLSRVELVAHFPAALLEPTYWLSVIQNLIEMGLDEGE